MRTGGANAARAATALLVLVAVCLASSPLRAEEDGLSARAFEVHYRSLADAAELIEAVLSAEGEYTIRPRLKTLVVQDRPSVLDRVEALLERWDVPPRNAEVTISLVLGSDRREDRDTSESGADLSREVRGVLESLGDFTRWTDYEPLGSQSVTGAEGESVVANLSDEYRVVFVLESVREKQGKIKFERFALQRLRVEEGGRERYEDVYAAGMVLTAGRVTLVGAARESNSKNALFLAVQATPR